MSDLKYQTVEQLERSKSDCIRYISRLKQKLSGQEHRLHWIDKYLFEKTPQELTVSQIESRLGHKVIVKFEDR